jgi:hypothetical protein
MEENFSIDEILSAVDEIQKKERKEKIEPTKNNPFRKDFSAVPQNTLNLIREAEDTKK